MGPECWEDRCRKAAELSWRQEGVGRALIYSRLVGSNLQSTKHLHIYDPLNLHNNLGDMVYYLSVTEEIAQSSCVTFLKSHSC